MSRMHVDDGEIGRGRQNDSSSSRESSPRRPQKRSFTPNSDDGDLVIPPIAYDDTPPPQERPLLRQAVAFATATPTTLETYQASVASVADPNATYFLPGQEVPLPRPPKRSTRPKAKKTDISPKKRKMNEFSAQTGRFRLPVYDPSPSAEPPIHSGDGPYSSMYRGASGNPYPPPLAAPLPEPAAPLPPLSIPTSPALTLTSSYGGNSSSTAFRFSSQESMAVNRHANPSTKKGKQLANKPSAARAKASNAKATSETGRAFASTNITSRLAQGSSRGSPSPRPGGGAYYRRDYERDTAFHEAGSMSPGPQRRRSPSPDPDMHRSQNSGASKHRVASSTSSAPGKANELKISKRSAKPLHMVTLLIQDIRSGVVDHQLTEIKMPLRPTADPTDGFWADAKLLSEQLQSGPSRIDGPAKVYTLRGKYRQFFLRVTAENVDEFISTNLIVKTDKVMDVVVEALPPPGSLPLPPQIPHGLRQESVSESPSPSSERDPEDFYAIPSWKAPSRLDVRRLGSPEQSYNRDGSADDSPQACPYGTPIRNIPPIRMNSSEPMPEPPRFKERPPTSPVSDDEPEEVFRLLVDAVDQIIQKDSEWIGFFQAMGALQPHRVLDVLKQYRFVKRMIDQWVGKRLPFRRSDHFIEAVHITEALKIKDINFGSACVETLNLLELYGLDGKHYQDERIVAMLNDTSRPEYNAKPIKRMLHLLRDIDEQWKEEHPPKPKPSSSARHNTEKSGQLEKGGKPRNPR